MLNGKGRQMTFFPTPYPDECYYSIFCRYFVRSGAIYDKKIVRELFGNDQNLPGLVFVPRRLELAEKWTGNLAAQMRRKFAYEHSAYPYFSIIFPEWMIEKMEKKITGETDESDFEKRMLFKCSSRHWPKYLRYCPECVDKDLEQYGETYWHQLHQLPGIEYCPEHRCRILNSTVQLRDLNLKFEPATADLKNGDICVQDSVWKEKYIRLANDSRWLLKNGQKLGGAKAIAEKYTEMLILKKMATPQGITYRDKLEKGFVEYHGEDFLKELLGEQYAAWMLLGNRPCTAKQVGTLYHLLMMEYLAGSAEEFYQWNEEIKFYGNGPWPCVNHFCSHYGKDGAVQTEISFQSGVPIGYFKCSFCGMKYRRNDPQKRFEEYVRHVHKCEYGNLWFEKVKELAGEGASLDRICKTCHCTRKRLINLCQEEGIELTREQLKTQKQRNLERAGFIRAEAEKLVEMNPELTMNEVDDAIPGAYIWFREHDPEWLRKHTVQKWDKSIWINWEKEQIELLHAAYRKLTTPTPPKERIVMAMLCREAGLVPYRIKNRRNRFKELDRFLAEHTETTEEWICRRIREFISENPQKTIKPTTIRYHLHLRASSYNKYRNLIEQEILKNAVVE